MLSFVANEFRHRRGRVLTLGSGILVAAVSFTLLTAAADTGALRVRGTLASNFRPAYDILVRPSNSYTPLEREQGLVAPNFASGIFGGITLHQWHEVLGIPGVDVAAPIANVGYMAPSATIRIPINRYLNADPVQLYRLRATWTADRGLSGYPGGNSFVYYTRQNRFVVPSYKTIEEVLPTGRHLQVCNHFARGLPTSQSPFLYSTRSGWGLWCFSERSPRAGIANIKPFRHGHVGSVVVVFYPFLVAAVDPGQERELVGLDQAIVRGRYLTGQDGRATSHARALVPVLASERAYVDEPVDVTIERLSIPERADVPRLLASDRAAGFVTHLPGTGLGQVHVSSADLWRREVEQLEATEVYWSTGPISYRSTGARLLSPIEKRNPRDVYNVPANGPVAAPGNQDVEFRRLQPHISHTERPAFRFQVVGTFDPRELSGFNSLSEVPLAAYAPPALEPADQPSREALGDQPLFPSMNLGGYIQQPPLVLTTLRAARALTNPSIFDGGSGAAPISVIRVRVAGVTGPDPLSLARIKSVAQQIGQLTGLAVDIVDGSSPQPMMIELPAGEYGRPALVLRERWVKKGVAVEILQALDRKSVALFLLILVVSGLFLMNGALASVRARRTEIGTLRCLGWRQQHVFRLVLSELAIVGAVAGGLGTLIAAGLVVGLSLHASLLRTLFVTPVAVVVATLAGLYPAWRATQIAPLEAVTPKVSMRSSGFRVRRAGGMAFVNLRRIPGRTLLAASGLLIGIGAFTFLLTIEVAFQGVLVGSVLGRVVSVQVRGVDLASVALAILLGVFSLVDVLVLNAKERAAEFLTLRASGWSDRHLTSVIALEGIGIGVLGAAPGVLVGVVLGAAAGGGGYQRIGLAAGVAMLAGVLVAAVASLAPALLVARAATPAVLGEE